MKMLQAFSIPLAFFIGGVFFVASALSVEAGEINSFERLYNPQVSSGDRIDLVWDVDSDITAGLKIWAECPNGVELKNMLNLVCTYSGQTKKDFLVPTRTRLYGDIVNKNETSQTVTFYLESSEDGQTKKSVHEVVVLGNSEQKLSPGVFVKSPNSSSVYYVTDDRRLSVIPHESVYFSYGYTDFSQVRTLGLSQFELTAPLSFPDGMLFRGTAAGIGGKDRRAVFVVEDGKLRPIISGDVYQKMYNDPKWSRVTWIPDDLLSKFSYPLGVDWTDPNQLPSGTVVRKGRDYYKIHKSGSSYVKQKLIGNTEELKARRINVDKALTVKDAFLTTLVPGGDQTTTITRPKPAELSDGAVIKKFSTLTIVTPSLDDFWNQEATVIVSWKYANMQDTVAQISLINSRDEVIKLGTVSIADRAEGVQESRFRLPASVKTGEHTLRICNGDVCARREGLEVKQKVLFSGQLITIEEVTGVRSEYKQKEKISAVVRITQAPEASQLSDTFSINVTGILEYGDKKTTVSGKFNEINGKYQFDITVPADYEGVAYLTVKAQCRSNNSLCSSSSPGSNDISSRRLVKILSNKLEIITPVSGASLSQGERVSISWKGGEGDTSTITLKSTTYPGTSTILREELDREDTYAWNILSSTPPGDYYIEIKQKTESGATKGTVQLGVNIVGNNNSIFPDLGDTVTIGETVTIKWPAWFVGESSDTVTIRLDKDGKSESSIASRVQNSGIYSWEVSEDQVTPNLFYSLNISPSGSTGIINTREFKAVQ